MKQLIGREEEQGLLKKYIDSDRSEFIAVYGRRRVGKTFLVTETFKDALSFDTSGVIDGDKKEQLVSFDIALKEKGYEGKSVTEWYGAFEALKEVVKRLRRNLLLLLLCLAGLLAVDAQTLSRKEVETYVINQYGKRWKDIALYLGEKDTLDKDNALTFEKTISVRGKSKNELFVDLNYWFLKTFSNASSSIEMADKELGVIMAKGYLPGIAYHSGGYSSYCVNIRPLVRCDIKDEQVKLTIVVPNYEVTKVDDGIWSAMLDEDFDKHPPYTVNETWSLNVCFPFAKKDGTKKTSSKALVMSHGYVEVLMNRIQMAL